MEIAETLNLGQRENIEAILQTAEDWNTNDDEIKVAIIIIALNVLHITLANLLYVNIESCPDSMCKRIRTGFIRGRIVYDLVRSFKNTLVFIITLLIPLYS